MARLSRIFATVQKPYGKHNKKYFYKHRNTIQEVTNMKPKNEPKKTVPRKNVSKPILSKRDHIKYGDKKHQNQFL